MVIAAAELAVTAYLALEAWLLTGWMVDDSLAAEWTTADWYRTGLVRLGIALCIAAVLGAVVYFVNGLAMRGLDRRRPRLRVLFAASLAAAVALGAIVGTVEFVTTKPYM